MPERQAVIISDSHLERKKSSAIKIPFLPHTLINHVTLLLLKKRVSRIIPTWRGRMQPAWHKQRFYSFRAAGRRFQIMAQYPGDTRDIKRNLCPQRNEGVAGVCICYNVNAPCSALRRLCAWTVRPNSSFSSCFKRDSVFGRWKPFQLRLRVCSLPRRESTPRGCRKLGLAMSRISQGVPIHIIRQYFSCGK